jgi:hypothetical protein
MELSSDANLKAGGASPSGAHQRFGQSDGKRAWSADFGITREFQLSAHRALQETASYMPITTRLWFTHCFGFADADANVALGAIASACFLSLNATKIGNASGLVWAILSFARR